MSLTVPRLAAQVASVSIALASLAGASATAAFAATSQPSDCPSDAVCVYEHQNFMTRIGYRQMPFKPQNVSANNNDKMTSWANTSGTKGCWYTDINGGGTKRYFYAKSDNSKVDLNDQMSSWAGSGC